MSRRWLLAFVAAATLAAGGVRSEDARPPEPEGFHTGALRGATPATLAGARVLDLPALEALMDERPVLIDVGPAAARPAKLPADTVWLPTHRSILGAAWLPGAGLGDLAPEREALLLEQVATLTGGDRAATVVVFCKPDCWASWNVGKRLVGAGYTGVAWFPGGVDAWQEAHPTAPVSAMPGWDAEPLASAPGSG